MESIHIKKELINRALAQNPTPGVRALEPLKSFTTEHGVPLNILEDNNVINDPEVHANEADLWYCLEGEADFVYGGTLVGKSIEGGIAITLKVGDWLWIPAGQPHQHGAKGVARLVVIKIPKV